MGSEALGTRVHHAEASRFQVEMPSEACIRVPVRACSCRWSSSVRCRHVRSFLDHHLATPPALHMKGLCALPNSDRTRGTASAEAPHEHPLHLSRRAHAATLQQKFLPNRRISNFSSTLRQAPVSKCHLNPPFGSLGSFQKRSRCSTLQKGPGCNSEPLTHAQAHNRLGHSPAL